MPSRKRLPASAEVFVPTRPGIAEPERRPKPVAAIQELEAVGRVQAQQPPPAFLRIRLSDHLLRGSPVPLGAGDLPGSSGCGSRLQTDHRCGQQSRRNDRNHRHGRAIAPHELGNAVRWRWRRCGYRLGAEVTLNILRQRSGGVVPSLAVSFCI